MSINRDDDTRDCYGHHILWCTEREEGHARTLAALLVAAADISDGIDRAPHNG